MLRKRRQSGWWGKTMDSPASEARPEWRKRLKNSCFFTPLEQATGVPCLGRRISCRQSKGENQKIRNSFKEEKEEIVHEQSRTELEEEEGKKTGSVRMLPETPEPSDTPGTIGPTLSKQARKEARHFARRAESLRENLLRRRRQQHAARAIAQKEGR